MRILASYNIKGGVGKTATAVNLAYLAAKEGYSTLIWDLDPQGASSYYLRVKARVKSGVSGLLREKRALADVIKATDFSNLDLIPADFSYRHLDLHLDDDHQGDQRLRALLKPLASEYDLIFIDCPPSISLASESIFQAAQTLIVPTIPTPLSLNTLQQLIKFRRQNNLKRLQILPFFSMVDYRKNMHRQIVTRPPEKLKGMLSHHIPYASEIEQMGIHRAPLGDYAAHGRAIEAYRVLWQEVKCKIKLTHQSA